MKTLFVAMSSNFNNLKAFVEMPFTLVKIAITIIIVVIIFTFLITTFIHIKIHFTLGKNNFRTRNSSFYTSKNNYKCKNKVIRTNVYARRRFLLRH